MTATWIDDHTEATMLRQIGRTTVLAVSGGQVARSDDGDLILPVQYGYDVRVLLDRGTDTYTVTRTFRRGGRVWIKATWSRVHAEDLSDVVYRASCYRDAPEGADR